MRVRGNGYDITVYETSDTWAVVGNYKDVDIDSLWAEEELPTFDDADAAVLEVIVEEEK